jgi:two-component system response regulator YesN
MSNYKLIIADDENTIRTGLVVLCNWNDLGFEIVETFEDGSEIISYLNNGGTADVILTDIKMSMVSGLEVAKFIYNKNLPIRVVLLSGYKDFEYAQQAIKYNVTHYLLKPTIIREITDAFRSIKEVLDYENETRMKLNDYKEMQDALSIQFFSDAYMGIIRHEEQIRKRFQDTGLSINLNQCNCCIIEISISNYEEYLCSLWQHGEDRLYHAIKQIIIGNNTKIYYFDILQNHDIIIVLAISSDVSSSLFEQSILIDIKDITDNIKDILKLNVAYKVEERFDDFFSFVQHHQKVMIDVNGKFITTIDSDLVQNYSEKQKMFISYINACNFSGLITLFDNFMEDLSEKNLQKVQSTVISLFAVIDHQLKNIEVNLSSLGLKEFDYSTIMELDSFQAIRVWGYNFFQKLGLHFQKYSNSAKYMAVKKAKEFMYEHYGEDITLDDVSNHVYFSSMYLSHLFREQTGESFIDHLVRVRMEKAMELLKDSRYKIYEVTDMVNYKSLKYFNKIFKRYTGLTPKEYRKQILSIEQE